jgi:hypothetical protein
MRRGIGNERIDGGLMGRWSAPDDYSYYEDANPPDRIHCLTPQCPEFVTFPDFEVYCSRCIRERRNGQYQTDAELEASAVRRI